MNWVSIVVFIDTSSFITPDIDFTILWTNNSLQKIHFYISLPFIKINILIIMDEKRQSKAIYIISFLKDMPVTMRNKQDCGDSIPVLLEIKD